MRKYFATLMLCALLASSAAAQSDSRLLYRDGDEFRGPVRSVRTEVVKVSLRDGKIVEEGPRVLTQVKKYSADGRRCETIKYDGGGSQLYRDVHVYNEVGKLAEKESYDAADSLLRKQVNSFDEHGLVTLETLYAGDGALTQKRFLIYSAAKDRLLEIVTYDGAGEMIRREVNSQDAPPGKVVWHIEEAGGRRSEQTFDLNRVEPRLEEAVAYRADGTVASRDVTSSEEPAQRFDETRYNEDGSVATKTIQRREYDSHRNVKRVNHLRWNQERGAFEPDAVLHNIISYD